MLLIESVFVSSLYRSPIARARMTLRCKASSVPLSTRRRLDSILGKASLVLSDGDSEDLDLGSVTERTHFNARITPRANQLPIKVD